MFRHLLAPSLHLTAFIKQKCAPTRLSALVFLSLFGAGAAQGALEIATDLPDGNSRALSDISFSSARTGQSLEIGQIVTEGREERGHETCYSAIRLTDGTISTFVDLDDEPVTLTFEAVTLLDVCGAPFLGDDYSADDTTLVPLFPWLESVNFSTFEAQEISVSGVRIRWERSLMPAVARGEVSLGSYRQVREDGATRHEASDFSIGEACHAASDGGEDLACTEEVTFDLGFDQWFQHSSLSLFAFLHRYLSPDHTPEAVDYHVYEKFTRGFRVDAALPDLFSFALRIADIKTTDAFLKGHSVDARRLAFDLVRTMIEEDGDDLEESLKEHLSNYDYRAIAKEVLESFLLSSHFGRTEITDVSVQATTLEDGLALEGAIASLTFGGGETPLRNAAEILDVGLVTTPFGEASENAFDRIAVTMASLGFESERTGTVEREVTIPYALDQLDLFVEDALSLDDFIATAWCDTYSWQPDVGHDACSDRLKALRLADLLPQEASFGLEGLEVSFVNDDETLEGALEELSVELSSQDGIPSGGRFVLGPLRFPNEILRETSIPDMVAQFLSRDDGQFGMSAGFFWSYTDSGIHIDDIALKIDESAALSLSVGVGGMPDTYLLRPLSDISGAQGYAGAGLTSLVLRLDNLGLAERLEAFVPLVLGLSANVGKSLLKDLISTWAEEASETSQFADPLLRSVESFIDAPGRIEIRIMPRDGLLPFTLLETLDDETLLEEFITYEVTTEEVATDELNRE